MEDFGEGSDIQGFEVVYKDLEYRANDVQRTCQIWRFGWAAGT